MALIVMNMFNVFIILFSLGYNILFSLEETIHSTGMGLLQFGKYYGIPLILSAFNCLSFLSICSSFRDFVRKLVLDNISQSSMRATT